ncbi:MAG: type III-B CRISPR-associated protein Cas10/Cmr2, partial [Candidatus Electrothrix sp. ATG2]|nr:type III-B CRISPR-associated protein Cas10/Cmr2 [Candidatus Electrothrix sp. ATG2]
MSNQETWLISLSIGPVQDFISAALRTRDLWFGSHMLSEVSKAAAREINKHEAAELIFPTVDMNSEELEENSPLNVANRIVAEMSGDENTVKEAIGAGKEAAKQKLSCLIEQAKSKVPIPIRKKIWDIQAQPDDLLELYGTAVRIKDENYPKAWKDLSRLNSARKNSRDFKPQLNNPEEDVLYGLPKSSLDGRRETVLPESLSKQVRRRLRMGEGEQLDVMGLVKRLAGGELNEQKQFNPSAKLQFTPTTRIAIDPWLRKIKDEEKDDVKKNPSSSTLKKISDTLGKYQNILMDTGLMTKVQGNEKIFGDMPFDAGLLYRSVLEAHIQKSKNEGREREENILKGLGRGSLKDAWTTYGQPCPYYALLLADGDHMGNLIKAAQDKDHHKEISKCLSEFARSVPETARKEEYRAHCIYAGGDDVLLMAPLDTVLPLADELRTAFTEKLQKVAGDLD